MTQREQSEDDELEQTVEDVKAHREDQQPIPSLIGCKMLVWNEEREAQHPLQHLLQVQRERGRG